MKIIAIVTTGFLIGVLTPGDVTVPMWWVIAMPLCILNAIIWNVLIKE